MKLFQLFIILAILLTTGCSVANDSQTPVAVDSTVNQSDGSYPYPAPDNEVSSAYPAQEPQVEMPPTPTFDPAYGIVKGILQLQGKPVANADMYLAKVILDESGKDVAAVLDRPTSPRARTDEQGNFAFVNVEAGGYGLVIDTVLESFVLLQPGTEDQIRLTVTAGQTTDLGSLNFDDLPVN